MKSYLNTFFSIILLLHIHFAASNRYTVCNNTFNCGEITGIDYPFWGGDRPKQCGYPDLHLNCNTTTTTITISKLDYRVLQIDQADQIITIKRNDLSVGDICPDELINTTIESSLFEYASTYVNFTIQFGCPDIDIPIPFPDPLTCTINGSDYRNNFIVPGALGPGPCKASIVIPVKSVDSTGIGGFSDVGKLIEGGFDVRWKVDSTDCSKCKSAGGRCGFDLKLNRFVCVCPESDQPPEGNGGRCSGGNLVDNTVPIPPSSQLSPDSDTTTIDNDDNNRFYQNCSNTFNCGTTITGIRYPFRGSYHPSYCGYPGLVLDCDNNTNSTTINIVNQKYIVLDISLSDQTMKIVREDVMKDVCPSDQVVNSTLDFTLFDYSRNYINATFLYGCPINLPPSQIVVPCDNVYAIFGLPPMSSFGVCRTSVVYPVLDESSLLTRGGSVNATDTGRILQQGFEIRWKVDSSACIECVSSKGRCGYDFGTSQPTCFCPDPTHLTTNGTCSLVDAGNGSIAGISPDPAAPFAGKSGKKGTSTGIVIPIVGAVLAGIGFGWLVFYCRQRRKRLVDGSRELSITDKKELPTTPLTNKDEAFISPSIGVTRKVPSYPSTQSEFGRDTSYFGAKVFSYAELEEATENFAESRQIGDGGFGAVYYGKLADGCIVAVKRLYENNFKRVEQFMNEVEILTRLRHSHLVTLYGCTSKRSRELLLVYEYVPNGTVADHLHGKRANSRLLSWPVRLNIAIETADALAYLHASDIIHRDVKTTNILLDNDFHVKVADFGLVRLFPSDATHVSTAPQGTPGYVDPDYYQCYQLTEKSDVYSFGVVLIELISSLQAVDTNRHRHEINLSNMAVSKIQNHTLHELVDPNLQFEADACDKRMITVVAELAFRCLQQEKEMRPSMQEVLDTLVGIKNANLGSGKVQVLSIIVDDGDHLLNKDSTSPFSPDSVTNTWASGSTKNSSG